MGKERMHRHVVGGHVWEKVYLKDQDQNVYKIKMYLKETGYEDDRWMELAYGRVQWRNSLLTALKLRPLLCHSSVKFVHDT
jgi:hypothetical protein